MILSFNFPSRLHIHQNIKVEHDPRETNFQNPDSKHKNDVWDLGLKIRYPRIIIDFYNLTGMKSKSEPAERIPLSPLLTRGSLDDHSTII